MANDHAALTIKFGQSADDRSVVGIAAITMQFHKFGEQTACVVKRVGTLRMARDLRDLPRCQLGINGLVEITELAR